MSNIEKIVAFQGEGMLLQWGESNTRGRTVTFLLSDEGDAHPFRDFTVKSGKKAGQRFMLAMVQIDDDETAVQKTAAQMAFLLCKDETFWRYINEHSFLTVEDEEGARDYVLETCRVKSRGDLDKLGHAKALWDAMVYEPFCKYRTAVERMALS